MVAVGLATDEAARADMAEEMGSWGELPRAPWMQPMPGVPAGAEGAGIVMGTRVPIVLTSRADSVRSRLASTAVMAIVANVRRTGKGEVTY